jgi:predicted ATP-grasp superfamily ATP-dependent carboligase
MDSFADVDTCHAARRCVTVKLGNSGFDPESLLKAVEDLSAEGDHAGLVYGSGLEKTPELLGRLAKGRRLYGNAPDVVRLVKTPETFFALLDSLSIPYPEVRYSPPKDRQGWLSKRVGGGGGGHVMRLAQGVRPSAHRYFQRYLPGKVMSVLFLADGTAVRLIGFNTQWTAQVRASSPFLFGGAVNRASLAPAQRRWLEAKIYALVAAIGLRGLNSLDFVLADDQPRVLEVNPRPSATFELYEPDFPEGLLSLHLRACEGVLPPPACSKPRPVRGQAIVYAAEPKRIAPFVRWPAWCRDIPQAGTRIKRGQPICSLFAQGESAGQVRRQLERRMSFLQKSLETIRARA